MSNLNIFELVQNVQIRSLKEQNQELSQKVETMSHREGEMLSQQEEMSERIFLNERTSVAGDQTMEEDAGDEAMTTAGTTTNNGSTQNG